MEVVNFMPPGEITPGTHWIGGWVGLTVSLNVVEKRKFPGLVRIRTPEQSGFYFWNVSGWAFIGHTNGPCNTTI
jgi:hypothetical protein